MNKARRGCSIALRAVQDTVFIVASAVRLNDLGKVELGDFVGGCIDCIEVDRIAGLEVRSEVDAIGRAYIDPCFMCELIVSLFDEGKFW